MKKICESKCNRGRIKTYIKKVAVSILAAIYMLTSVPATSPVQVQAIEAGLVYGGLCISDIIYGILVASGVTLAGGLGGYFLAQNDTTLQDAINSGLMSANPDGGYDVNLDIGSDGKIIHNDTYDLSDSEYQILDMASDIAVMGSGGGGMMPSDPNNKKTWLQKIFNALGETGTKGVITGVAVAELMNPLSNGFMPYNAPSIATGVEATQLNLTAQQFDTFSSLVQAGQSNVSYVNAHSYYYNADIPMYYFSELPVYSYVDGNAVHFTCVSNSPQNFNYTYCNTRDTPSWVNRVTGTSKTSYKLGDNLYCSYPGYSFATGSIAYNNYDFGSWNAFVSAVTNNNLPTTTTPDAITAGDTINNNTLIVPIIQPTSNVDNAYKVPERDELAQYINNINNYYNTKEPDNIQNIYNTFNENHITNYNQEVAPIPPYPTYAPAPTTIPRPTSTPGQVEDNTQNTTAGMHLEEIFPFCIPFDVINMLKSFTANRQAPHIQWQYHSNFFNYDINIDLDFSMFDSIASLFRTLELIMFVIGLALLTKFVLF